MQLSLEEWHARFVEQSNWTAPLRAFLFSQIELSKAVRVFEVGCGTGAILHPLPENDLQKHYGVDFDFERVAYAHQHNANVGFSCADGLNLPFMAGTFDITFCHYYLLWLPNNGAQALREMSRVTRSGGIVLTLAEPAYSQRIDYPADLAELGKLQTLSLTKQGIDPNMGLRLSELFSQAGLKEIQYGQSGFQSPVGQLPGWFESEWKTLRSDLEDTTTPAKLQQFQERDRQAWLDGSRVLQIPTFYAYGKVS
jgi:ubiquinone/menaquinone biosynthesis C-methylase UbiE